MAIRWQTMMPWAGLASGPGAWIVSTQANYALVPTACSHTIPIVPLLALALAGVALAGAALSWRVWRSRNDPTGETIAIDGLPHLFLACVSIGAAVLFALVILVQGAAGLLLTGCER